ncbi:FAD-dependent monooxygenase [Aquimarina sp. 2201CG14-23]|uniref:FAD-dependent monooxygenase n=1 Tax=Aquimarina mycalae TaxID=3040073 RepID=UPI0024780081|nr:FAD-dependent monooxygenase [Aquimarina sp. 2201CG14-23]MDH7447858.1 FAD-dependent monooxygenase [Aquimarina sp. 2201CG14-23]
MTTDVIIIGGGISGIVLSILLKRKHIDHVVLDRVQKQKVMPLAETLPPSAMILLNELNLLELFENKALKKTYGYHALWGNDHLRTTHFFNHNPYKYGLKIDKQVIQNELKAQITEQIIQFDTLKSLKTTSEKVSVTVNHQKKQLAIQGKLIIDATGRNRAVLEALHIPIQEHDTIISFSCHLPRVQHPSLVHDVFTESFADGWGIVSGLNENTQVLTLFTHKNTGLNKQLKDYNNWKYVLQDTHYLKHFLAIETPDTIIGSKANSSAPLYFSGDRWLAIGDAVIAYDPLSSHGITNAIYTAKKAEQCVSQSSYTLEKYHEDLHAIFSHYLETKDVLYKQEQRWPDNTFWQQVQNKVLQ